MSLNDWFAIDRHATPSMVGVPKAQRRQVESHYEGGIVAFAQNRGRRRPLQDFLLYHHELAADLHARDRVHTYGSFAIADVTAAA